MADDEVERLRRVLAELVERSGRSQRDIERELELGHGYLNHLLSGRMELKFRHVLLLGRALGFSLSEFIRRAYPPVSYAPEWPALEVKEEFAETGVLLRSPALGTPVERDALKETLRELLTELLLEAADRPRVRGLRRGGKQARPSSEREE